MSRGICSQSSSQIEVPRGMSKLSQSLKMMVQTVHEPPARWSEIAFKKQMQLIQQEAVGRGLGLFSWLAIVTATTMTIGSPESMRVVAQHIIQALPLDQVTEAAEYSREIAMICLAMVGVQAPQVIRMLSAFCEALLEDVKDSLDKTTSRRVNMCNITTVEAHGRELWAQVHQPFGDKLEQKFTDLHPGLSHFIIGSVYGNLFTNVSGNGDVSAGRLAVSLTSVACLRARPGFQRQLFDHICGLKNVYTNGPWNLEPNIGPEESVSWLASDDGCAWILDQVDKLANALREDKTSSREQDRARL